MLEIPRSSMQDYIRKNASKKPTRESIIRSAMQSHKMSLGMPKTVTWGANEEPPEGIQPPVDYHKRENFYPKFEGKIQGFEDNSRILCISDLHIPYMHPDAFDFLRHLKAKYNPTRIICMGDELDKHALSFHDSDPDLDSAGVEMQKSLKYIKELHSIFPVMDILDSNHGSLVYRKAKSHGIPKHFLKSYNEFLEVDAGWKWHFDLTLKLPNGQDCYFHHGKTNRIGELSQKMGMCAVAGHYHSDFCVHYWANPNRLLWGLQTGCLIDNRNPAFSYANVNIKQQIIGTGLIIDSLPVLEPMIRDSKTNRWIGP